MKGETDTPSTHSHGGRSATSRKVLKVMSIFTGVESVGILCSIVKMKIVALWLDAVGVGLFSIFNTTIETATYFTGLGLRQSAVRDVSLASREGEGALRRIIGRVRSWSVAAGIAGALTLIALAWPLSEIIFGESRMWWCFALLSASMLLNALYNGEAAIFQGTENFRRIARTGLEMSIVGLVISVPMFRWMGEGSVAWSIVAYSAAGVVFAWLNRNRTYSGIHPSRADLKDRNQFVKFGAWISLTSFISSLTLLIFNAWLNREASTAEVGLYAAGVTIVVRYTSLVFNSVALEYYPRISANVGNMRRVEVFMNHEIVLLLLLFTPLMLLFMIFREWIVLLLYKPDFLQILPFVTWGIVTVILRAVSNTMAYTILARGDGKVYFLTDTADALIGLGLSIWLYSELGLTGVGVAMVVWHLLYLLIAAAVCRMRYGLVLRQGALRLMTISFLTAGGALIAIAVLPAIIRIPVMVIAAIIYLLKFKGFLTSRPPRSHMRQ